MGSSLTQVSHKASHKDAARLTRKGGVYYYRRRLPDRLGTDVAISLGTRNFREAEHLASQLDATFDQVVSTVSNPADLRAILRTYLAETLEDDATMRLHARPGRPVYTPAPLTDDDDAVDVDLEIVEYLLGEAREQLANRDFASVGSTVDQLASEHSVPEAHRKALAHGVLEAKVRALVEIRRRVLGEVSTIFTDDLPAATMAATPVPPPIPSGPLLSIAAKRYCAYGTKEKGWRGQTLAQTKATFAMFQEIAGDRIVSTYTRKDLSAFYDVLRSLPALYAKDRRWRDLPLAEIGAASADDPMARLTMKTVKRHFSALGAFFSHAKQHGQFDGENPAYGFQFPTKGRANNKRKVWEGEKLAALFKSPVWTGSHKLFRTKPGANVIRDEKFWLPLLGLYHGNRLEEFAQLRGEDLKEQEGVSYFFINGEDGRQIKNEQSARRVPIHPVLEQMGFLEYARTTAPAASDPLFPLLLPGGPDNKVGYYFTKWWTNYRRGIGLYEIGLDYHSFRHGVTSKLFAARVPRDIIDELTGHEGEGTSQTVYKHDTPIGVLKEAIENVRWAEVVV